MRFLSVLIAALTVFAGSTAGADQISIDSAVALVRGQTGDRILRAKPGNAPDGREVYLVRLLREDGGMYTLEVDAETGETKEVSTGPLVMPRGAPPIDEAEPDSTNEEDVDPCAS
jgi:hypothetical protein